VPNTNSNKSAVDNINPVTKATENTSNVPVVDDVVIGQPTNHNVSSIAVKETNPSLVAQSGSTAGSSKIPKVARTRTTKKTEEIAQILMRVTDYALFRTM